MAMLEARRMGRMTAGRVIFDLRRQGLFMHRESRDLPMTTLAAGEDGVWDARYRISNPTARQMIVGPSFPDRDMANALFVDVPVAIAMRAMAVMPHIASMPPLAQESAGNSPIAQPILTPFDRFLPQFDVILGRELGELFGCEALPATRINVLERKS
jgi:tRNA(Ile)-lysidine synthase